MYVRDLFVSKGRISLGDSAWKPYDDHVCLMQGTRTASVKRHRD